MANDKITSVPRDPGWKDISNPKIELSLRQIKTELDKRKGFKDEKRRKDPSV